MKATKTLSLVFLLTVAAACTPGSPAATPSQRPSAPGSPSPASPAPGTPAPGTPAPATPAPGSPTPNPSGNPPASGAAGVDGRDFIAKRITDDGEPITLVPDTQIRIGFHNGQVSASAGCNQFGGSYRIDGARIVIDGGSMTEMGCDPARMAQDDWLVRFLNNDATFALDGDELTLTYENAEMVLLDAEVAEPDQPLTGVTWMLNSIITGDAVSSVPGEAVATIVFNADRSVDVRPGCNSGGGDYTVAGNTITFGDIFLTRMACMEPFMQVEQAVLDVLSAEGGVSYAIDAGTLTLMAGDIGLQFIGGAAQ